MSVVSMRLRYAEVRLTELFDCTHPEVLPDKS